MSSFQNLFNEYNISTSSLETENLIVTGTIDLSGASITGFPVDDTTIEINGGVLAVKESGIKTQQLANNSVSTTKIVNKSVTTEKLGDDSVTNEKLEDNSVTNNKIADLNVSDDKIVSVSSSKVIGTIVNDINNDMIITEDLSVNGNVVVIGALDVKDITAQNITAVETLDAKNITSENITAVDTIDAKNITVENITIENATLPSLITVNNLNVTGTLNVTGDLGSFPVDESTINISIDDELQVKDFGITANKLADDSVTTNKLDDYAVTTMKIDVNSIDSDRLQNNSVILGKINANAIVEGNLTDYCVTENKLGAGAVTNSKLSNHAVREFAMDDLSVPNRCIVDSAVTSSKIADRSIISNKIDNLADIRIEQNLFVDKQISANNLLLYSTTESTSTTTGSLITPGGVGIVKNLNVGGKTMTRASGGGESSPDIYTQTTSNNVSIGFSTGTSSNRVMLAGRGYLNNPYKLIEWDAWNGGGGVTDFNNTNLFSQSNVAINYNNTRVNIPITTDSSSSTNGALITAGGVGIAKNLYVGTSINTPTLNTETINSSGPITANLLVGSTTPSGSLVSLNTPSNYPGIIITRGSNKRWDIQNASSLSNDDLFINSKNANNSSATTKLRLGWGSADTTHLGSFSPDGNILYTLGNSSNRWSNIFSSIGNFSNYLTVVNSDTPYKALVNIEHTVNASGNSSQMRLIVAGDSSGDPYITHQVTGGASFSTGIDNDDSDKYKISNSSSLGTNDALTIDTSQTVSLNKNIGTVGGYAFYGCRAFTRFNGNSASNMTATYTKFAGSTNVTVDMIGHPFKLYNRIYIQYDTSSGTLPTSALSTITSTSPNSFVATGLNALGVTGNLTVRGRSFSTANNVNFISYVDVGKYIVNFNKDFLTTDFATTVNTNYNIASSRYDVSSGVIDSTSNSVQVYSGFGSFSFFNATEITVLIHFP